MLISHPSEHGNVRRGMCMHAKSLQSCLTLWDSMDCSLPDSSVHGILQRRILEWVAMPSSRDRTRVSSVSCIGRRALYLQHHLGRPRRSIMHLNKQHATVELQAEVWWQPHVLFCPGQAGVYAYLFWSLCYHAPFHSQDRAIKQKVMWPSCTPLLISYSLQPHEP